MKLSQICEKVEYTLLQGDSEVEIADIIYDSRKVKDHTVFICTIGVRLDGHDFIEEAIQKGATAFVIEKDIDTTNIPQNITILRVASARKAMAYMSAAFFGYPAKELVTIGITGTKGKTTTTYMIKGVLEAAGKKAGLIGTIGSMIGEEKIASKNTTPESYELHKMFRQMVEQGCEFVVMEVSSQGIKMDRTTGILFDYAVFTNLSPDHIGPGEHESFEEYLECKSRLFQQSKCGIVNADDIHVEEILKNHTCEVKRYSCDKDCDLKAYDIGYLQEDGKLGMHFKTKGIFEDEIKVHIPGKFSVYNSLVCVMVSALAKIPKEKIKQGLHDVTVKGRVEMVPISKDFWIIIDYAHNEVSTRSVLATLKEYKPNRLICVYGGGGNRSKLRRYDMGEVTGEMADLSVLTADNPRDEEIASINEDIKVGLAKHNGTYIEIEDRAKAISYCIEHVKKGDMIVLLGKGHEDYQEIKGVKYHFDERQAIHQAAVSCGYIKE